jgi:AraC family transcriptional regulator
MNVEWFPTVSNTVTAAGFRVMHGGPAPMRLREHEHAEAQVEVHFRAPGFLPGDAELIAPGRPHIGEWEAGSEVVVMLIPPMAFERAADEVLIRNRFAIPDRELAGDPFIHQLASSFRRQFRSAMGVSRLFAESGGYLLAEHILRTYGAVAPVISCRERLDETRLTKLVRYIDENLEGGFTVAQMARAMGMGVHSFARSLRLATGRTPHEFVQARRVQLAKMMLREGRKSLAEIALRLGFAGQSHFTAVFRRSTRVTPNVYRRESL